MRVGRWERVWDSIASARRASPAASTASPPVAATPLARHTKTVPAPWQTPPVLPAGPPLCMHVCCHVRRADGSVASRAARPGRQCHAGCCTIPGATTACSRPADDRLRHHPPLKRPCSLSSLRLRTLGSSAWKLPQEDCKAVTCMIHGQQHRDNLSTRSWTDPRHSYAQIITVLQRLQWLDNSRRRHYIRVHVIMPTRALRV